MMDCGIERRFKGDYQAIFAVEASENPCRAIVKSIAIPFEWST
jgi:hypothetical protein